MSHSDSIRDEMLDLASQRPMLTMSPVRSTSACIPAITLPKRRSLGSGCVGRGVWILLMICGLTTGLATRFSNRSYAPATIHVHLRKPGSRQSRRVKLRPDDAIPGTRTTPYLRDPQFSRPGLHLADVGPLWPVYLLDRKLANRPPPFSAILL